MKRNPKLSVVLILAAIMFIMMVVSQLAGCSYFQSSRPMTNDEIITVYTKCHAAGMGVKVISGEDGTTYGVICAAPNEKGAVPRTALKDDDLNLQSYYAGYNETLFMDQLPKNTVVRWGDLTGMPGNGDMGDTFELGGASLIVVDRTTNPTSRGALMTLIHEMCHVKTNGKEFDVHGPKFQGCMLDVAEQGGFRGLW